MITVLFTTQMLKFTMTNYMNEFINKYFETKFTNSWFIIRTHSLYKYIHYTHK